MDNNHYSSAKYYQSTSHVEGFRSLLVIPRLLANVKLNLVNIDTETLFSIGWGKLNKSNQPRGMHLLELSVNEKVKVKNCIPRIDNFTESARRNRNISQDKLLVFTFRFQNLGAVSNNGEKSNQALKTVTWVNLTLR